jgi:guanylate kinase
MNTRQEKCSRCGNIREVMPSNNPLVKGICNTCANEVLDASRLEHFEFFCRTFNLPFSPNAYMILYQKYRNNVFVEYVKTLIDDGKIKFDEPTGDVWKEIEKEWSKIKTHTDIMLKLPAVREGFEERARAKWGMDYTFIELIQLENLLINTIKAHNVTEPMRLDAIKKAAKISVKIDALIEAGDAKSIKDYTAAYQSFLKAANIDELGQVANEGTIKTVSDLYKYMEKNGFEFKFYDKEDRDIVDKTIQDIKNSIRHEIGNATGLEHKLEEMQRNFGQGREEQATEEAIAASPLADILGEDFYDDIEFETDKELASEELDIEYDE